MSGRVSYYFSAGIISLKQDGVISTTKKIINLAKSKITTTKNEKRFSASQSDRFLKYLEGLNGKLRLTSNNPDFKNKTDTPYERKEGDVKLIAWYLPQYYEMDVNNKYHGAGFTEWTSVTRNMPLFEGHIQPHLPYDVGFYNLTMYESLKKQVDLANEYGIYGFCIDYYWFSGTKTMEKPLELLYKNKDLDTHYCLNWCTENWTALWDGENKGLIFEQKLEDDDDVHFFNDALPYFKDERYIKIDGKPVLMIYKCKLFDKNRFKQFLETIRECARDAGLPDLYIMLTTADYSGDAEDYGADAICEYPTMNIGGDVKANVTGYVNPNFKCADNVLDYSLIVNNRTFIKSYPSKSVYYSLLTNFDNSPRKGYSDNCIITINSTPDLYKKWLKETIERTVKEHDGNDRLAFILAWNEWAESSHLEPDLYYGYGYLEATRNALREEQGIDDKYIHRRVQQKKNRGIDSVHFYIHCIESLGDVIACEPIPRYLKNTYPGCKVSWIAKKTTADVVKYNPNIDDVIVVDYLGQSIDLINEKAKESDSIIVDCHQDGRRCVVTDRIHRNPANPAINEYTYLNYGSLLANFCLSAGLPALDDAPKFYIRPDAPKFSKSDREYVVFHCKSAETCKDWSVSKWKELTEKIIRLGYNVVEIGLEPMISIENPHYIDMTSEHDIHNIARIIEDANAFIGIDSAFAHLANCLDVYGILIFGKYKYFDRPMMYTGNYANGKRSTIIFADNDQNADKVSVEQVYGTFQMKCHDTKSC